MLGFNKWFVIVLFISVFIWIASKNFWYFVIIIGGYAIIKIIYNFLT